MPKRIKVSDARIARGVCRFHYESRDKQSITECVHPSRSVFIGPGGYLYGACGYHFGQAVRMRYVLHPAFKSGDVRYMVSTWKQLRDQTSRVLTPEDVKR